MNQNIRFCFKAPLNVRTSRMKKFLIVLLILLTYGELSLADNRDLLKECPDRPNCVSTTSSSERSRMEPIAFKGSVDDAQKTLESIITSMPGAKILKSRPGRLITTFTSSVFGFVDDVEFALDDSKKLINFRSASRVGYYDFGVNRRRMEAITKAFNLAQSE